MKRYNPSEIEPKWQQIWTEDNRYKAVDFDDKPKYYVTGMFPYPSGAGMHAGHFMEHILLVNDNTKLHSQDVYEKIDEMEQEEPKTAKFIDALEKGQSVRFCQSISMLAIPPSGKTSDKFFIQGRICASRNFCIKNYGAENAPPPQKPISIILHS